MTLGNHTSSKREVFWAIIWMLLLVVLANRGFGQDTITTNYNAGTIIVTHNNGTRDLSLFSGGFAFFTHTLDCGQLDLDKKGCKEAGKDMAKWCKQKGMKYRGPQSIDPPQDPCVDAYAGYLIEKKAFLGVSQ